MLEVSAPWFATLLASAALGGHISSPKSARFSESQVIALLEQIEATSLHGTLTLRQDDYDEAWLFVQKVKYSDLRLI